jgi:segregation and condensation protein B
MTMEEESPLKQDAQEELVSAEEESAGPPPSQAETEPQAEPELQTEPEPQTEAPETDGTAAPEAPQVCRVVGEPLDTVIEALLFVSAEPVKVARLAETTGSEVAEVRAALKRLAAYYDETHRAFELVEIARGFQVMTRSAFHEAIEAFRSVKSVNRLSPSAMETLAIIAYKQPLIRAEIEAIRGVQCGPVLRKLLDRKMVKVAGRDKRPGNPILYKTTNRFMEHFGLKSLKGLPSVEELRAPAG